MAFGWLGSGQSSRRRLQFREPLILAPHNPPYATQPTAGGCHPKRAQTKPLQPLPAFHSHLAVTHDVENHRDRFACSDNRTACHSMYGVHQVCNMVTRAFVGPSEGPELDATRRHWGTAVCTLQSVNKAIFGRIIWTRIREMRFLCQRVQRSVWTIAMTRRPCPPESTC
jgi:hypothetical protein